ncbi:hypothetical protein V5T82_14960 [Magnetovibrio sp. PR-2]|uniref:hypothetical protein n=1 Tax=Magnetovibrio sp. PR-2 TaxID=3120356 RepID=UPI002FCDF1A7
MSAIPKLIEIISGDIVLPSSLFFPLATTAASTINKVLTSGGARSSAPKGEVSAVRTMTLDGFDEIAAAWSPTLKAHGYRINLTSVFCHSRPHVSFKRVPSPFAPSPPPPDGRCELADLLIVIDYVDTHARQRERRAVLVQAKMLKRGKLKPYRNEWIQHELLAWLPSFTFVDSGYDPRARDLAGTPIAGNPRLTAEYGGIELKSASKGWWHWLPVKTNHQFVSQVDLSAYLAGMAVGDSSYARKAIIHGSDDWSFTVDELLRVTAKKAILKSKPKILRGNDNFVGFIPDTAQHLSSDGGGGGDHIPEGDIPEWPEGPISTVKMTLRPLDDPNRDFEEEADFWEP